MELTPVESSNVAAVGYDGSEQILFIRFKGNEKIYEHHGVPAEVFKELLASNSVGSYYARNVKKNYPSGGGKG